MRMAYDGTGVSQHSGQINGVRAFVNRSASPESSVACSGTSLTLQQTTRSSKFCGGGGRMSMMGRLGATLGSSNSTHRVSEPCGLVLYCVYR